MSSNILCGQAGLLGLPSIVGKDAKDKSVTGGSSSNKNRQSRRGTSLSDATLNPQLRVDRKRLKSDATTGMEVYKISKVGCYKLSSFLSLCETIYPENGQPKL